MAELLHLYTVFFVFIALVPSHPFTDYFYGLEEIEAVRQIFGGRTSEVLSGLKVHVIWVAGYMGVNPLNGHLVVNPAYLRNGDELDIYLDLIHELVHVRQQREGKPLFEGGYSYVERPTEVEAYRYAVEEAKRLGVTSERICSYLKTEWMSENDLRQLARTLGVE
ncbi:hypothetical protein MUP77_05560 [Candidatus Bathyarchaeota archaeon]|nr:hypothetical protein [Candidatus Bathyarchaeota archaeon]